MTFRPLLVSGALALLLAGCDRAPEPPAPPVTTPPVTTAPGAPAATPPASAAAGSSSEADAWLGRWLGPEGTYLEISRAELGGYALTIANLDGPTRYAARAVQGGIAFTRNGQDETLRATDGAATGMKWLADKKNCLTVKAGEGYCRD